MNPLTMALLRRVAVYALALAGALLALPAALTELGVIGPTAEETIDSAGRALYAARVYGAESTPEYAAAARELDEARKLARAGSERSARHAALRASESAVAAQRAALLRRDDERRRAEAIINDVDKQLNDLESLYDAVTPKVDKPVVSRLLSQMKEARKAGGGLFLAFEQGNYAKVLDDQPAAQAVLTATREALRNTARPAAGS
jgi:hypothetical protein